MAQRESMLRNIFTNVGGYIVSVIVAFLITPITIHTLGNARYGAWSLVAELIGYYGLLDLGIRGAVTYYIARHSALEEGKEIREIQSSAFWVLVACGGLVLIIGVALALGFPYIFRSEGLNLGEVRKALFIMSTLIAVSLPMNMFSGSLVGRQRFDIVSGIEALNRVFTAMLVYIVLISGGSLIGLALVQVVGRVISWMFIIFACRSILGGIFVRPKWFKWGRVHLLTAYGFRNAVGQIAQILIFRMDIAVVGMFAGMEQVTFYSIGSMLISYVWRLCNSIVQPFTPRFTQLESTKSYDQLQEQYLFGMRTIGMLIAGMSAGILIFGKDFIRLWLGADYVNAPWKGRSDVILSILILANFPRMLQSITWQRLYAMAKVRFLMWLNVFEAFANLSLSILLVHFFGAVGVALGTFFPLFLTHVLIMPFYSSRVFAIPFWELLRKGFAIPIITFVLMIGVNLGCIYFIAPTTWLSFIFDVSAAVILGGFLCIGVGFKAKERKDLFVRFQKRVVLQAPKF